MSKRHPVHIFVCHTRRANECLTNRPKRRRNWKTYKNKNLRKNAELEKKIENKSEIQFEMVCSSKQNTTIKLLTDWRLNLSNRTARPWSAGERWTILLLPNQTRSEKKLKGKKKKEEKNKTKNTNTNEECCEQKQNHRKIRNNKSEIQQNKQTTHRHHNYGHGWKITSLTIHGVTT